MHPGYKFPVFSDKNCPYRLSHHIITSILPEKSNQKLILRIITSGTHCILGWVLVRAAVQTTPNGRMHRRCKGGTGEQKREPSFSRHDTFCRRGQILHAQLRGPTQFSSATAAKKGFDTCTARLTHTTQRRARYSPESC